jgi:hypothetical protein
MGGGGWIRRCLRVGLSLGSESRSGSGSEVSGFWFLGSRYRERQFVGALTISRDHVEM